MSLYNKDNNPNDDFLDNSLNQNKENYNTSLWSRIFKNKENQVYSDIVIKGLVWVGMFIISLIALIMVFKDNGGKKEVVVVSNKNEKNIASDNFPVFTGNTEEKFLNSNSAKLTQESNDSNKSTQSNKKHITNTEETSNTNNIKSSTLSKEHKNEVKSPIEENESLDSLIRTATAPGTIKKTAVLKEKAVPAVKPENKNNLNKKTVGSNNTKVWLVTIYSGSEEALAKVKWKEIEELNPSLFTNKQPYFIKTNIEGKGIFYRVSLGEVKNQQSIPYFVSAKVATTYCEYLKNNKVNCFVTESTKENLSKLINR